MSIEAIVICILVVSNVVLWISLYDISYRLFYTVKMVKAITEFQDDLVTIMKEKGKNL